MRKQREAPLLDFPQTLSTCSWLMLLMTNLILKYQ